MIKESVKEFTRRAIAEARIDIDIEYCKKYNIKFDSREDEVSEDELWNRLSDTKRTKAIFDFLHRNR